MSRVINKHARGTPTGNNVRIDGKTLNVNLARLVYRCEACHGELKRHNAGLKCIANGWHRGFIHRSKLREIEAAQAENITALPYEIKDGKVIVKGNNDNGN